MDPAELDRTVGDLASSLGDATRRGIYLSVRAAPEPVTANAIAARFDVHPNVARHHLDRLVDDGYLDVTRPRRAGGPGAGRPAKHYAATDKEIAVQFPTRRFDLLADLLARAVERAAPEHAGAIAEEVGREYGLRLAAEVGLPAGSSFDAAMKAVAVAMHGVGFDTHVEDRALITTSCPFGAAAAGHPDVVCRLDKGIVRGLLEAAGRPSPVMLSPHEVPEAPCVARL